MFDLDKYLADLILNCRSAFGKRLLYMGLQGSWLRGEAHENSDIDIMVILDRFSVRDMDTYRGILKEIGFFERSCGFICGKDEMKRWNPLEVCQLRHTTKDLVGDLADYLPPATREDEINYVKLSLGNLYHELCHRYIHADRDKNASRFRNTCKTVFYLIQNLHFLENGHFILTKKELKEAVSAEDRRVLELAELPDGFDFDQAFSALFAWCQSTFLRVEKLGQSEYPIRILTESETDAALSLAWKVFTEYESPDYAPEGTEEFRKALEDQAYLAGLRYYGAFDGEKLIGLLAIRVRQRHICFFFVDGEYHRRGIGTKLFRQLLKDFPGQTITLNSSPYGLPFYKALGFKETDGEQTVNGIRFTPMEYK
ncbi:MAG: GNAT family N-acetyltransferase [Lachnospiraceae bacterium]|nr:GNAT family N-acetyltransferase [Lachnospiraceae bacterium]